MPHCFFTFFTAAQVMTFEQTPSLALEKTESVFLEETQPAESIPETSTNIFLEQEHKIYDFFICNHQSIRKLRNLGFFENNISNSSDLFQVQSLLFQIYHSNTPIAFEFRMNPEALENSIDSFSSHVWNKLNVYEFQSGLFFSRRDLNQKICDLIHMIKNGWNQS